MVLAITAAGCSSRTAHAVPRDTPPKATVTDPTAPTSTTEPEVSPFDALGPYLAGREGHITAAVFDARTDHLWTFNPGVVQDTASIVKVEIMGAILKQIEQESRPPTETEASLMSSMIENSDNDSATSLLDDVGGPGALATFDRSIGMTDTVPSSLAFIPGTSLPGWGLTTTSATDEVTLVSQFAFPSAALSRSSRDYGLSLMEHVEADQAWGVSAGVPAGTTVALKNGWLPLSSTDWQVNSIGWVNGAGRNYVLAILTTESPTESYGIDSIETVARSLFTQLG